MRSKLSFYFLLLLCATLPSGFGAGGQGRAEATARLFARYEHGASPHRLSEDVLTLTLSASGRERATVAIRVCSKEPTPFALVSAGANPFRVAEVLTHGYAYPPERVVYLRAEDCLSPKDPAVTEVWAVPQGASLPPHVEAYTSDQVRLTPLGRAHAERGVRDYRAALRQLIRDLRAKPTAVGVVFGYFLERPSPALRGRLREVERTLERSGLARERYLVRPKAWDDEVSTYPPDSEPKYPSLFVVEIAPEKARADESRLPTTPLSTIPGRLLLGKGLRRPCLMAGHGGRTSNCGFRSLRGELGRDGGVGQVGEADAAREAAAQHRQGAERMRAAG